MDGKFSQFSHLHFSSRSPNERATPLNALSHLPGPFGMCSDRGGGGGPQEVEPVVYNSDSEECVEFPEDGTKPVGALHASGSKRSRAAEVHNMSEKRRRNRINEKMKALQKLIPNSNKTDKASMLDEAIDYLKQLQLQVQMLSMRNGLNLHPMYIPGTLQSLQASQMELASSADNAGPLNVGLGMLQLSRDLTTNTFDLPSQDTLLHQSVRASVRSSNDEIVPHGGQPSQSQQGSFHLGMVDKCVVYGKDNTAHQQADISVARRQVTELQSTTAFSSLPVGQPPALQMANHMKLHGVVPHDELEKYQDNVNECNQISLQHMHGLQRGRVYCSDGLKGKRRVEF